MTDKIVHQDTMDGVRLIMTTAVLSAREICLETSLIGQGMDLWVADPVAGVQARLIWTETAVILNGKDPGKCGRMIGGGRSRETLAKV